MEVILPSIQLPNSDLLWRPDTQTRAKCSFLSSPHNQQKIILNQQIVRTQVIIFKHFLIWPQHYFVRRTEERSALYLKSVDMIFLLISECRLMDCSKLSLDNSSDQILRYSPLSRNRMEMDRANNTELNINTNDLIGSMKPCFHFNSPLCPLLIIRG